MDDATEALRAFRVLHGDSFDGTDASISALSSQGSCNKDRRAALYRELVHLAGDRALVTSELLTAIKTVFPDDGIGAPPPRASRSALPAPAAHNFLGKEWNLQGWLQQYAVEVDKLDAVVVLAGGVGESGKVHETVARRLEAAAALHKLRGEGCGPLPIITNGGGTAHKPKWVDAAGFGVPECHIMGSALIELGVPVSSIYSEGFSDDTIGNAYFLRVMHTEWRGWRNLMIITSDFQTARAEAVYYWMFRLEPKPKHSYYHLEFAPVPDDCLPREVLDARKSREAASLPGFRSGVGSEIHTMSEVHEFIFQKHKAYAQPLEAREPIDPNALKTY